MRCANARGVPQVIVPHVLDQYFWGDRVYRAGIGAKAVWRSRLTVRNLGSAIKNCIRDSGMRQTALEVRDALRGLDGVGMTIGALLKGT